MRVVIVGATSGIARETAACFASEGARLGLAARDRERLTALAADLRARGAAEVHEHLFEAADLEALDGLVDDCVAALGGVDAVLIAHGDMPDQLRAEVEPAEMLRALTVNGTSVAWLVTRFAALLEAQGSGCLAVLTSGAGERGRRSTYTYGMAKSLVTTQLQGLRARLHGSGVSVVSVFPCFVDTPMTAYLPPKLRFVPASKAGARVHRAMRRGTELVYIPRWWRLPLFLARNAPEWLVKRSRSEQRFLERLQRERDGDAGDAGAQRPK